MVQLYAPCRGRQLLRNAVAIDDAALIAAAADQRVDLEAVGDAFTAAERGAKHGTQRLDASGENRVTAIGGCRAVPASPAASAARSRQALIVASTRLPDTQRKNPPISAAGRESMAATPYNRWSPALIATVAAAMPINESSAFRAHPFT